MRIKLFTVFLLFSAFTFLCQENVLAQGGKKGKKGDASQTSPEAPAQKPPAQTPPQSQQALIQELRGALKVRKQQSQTLSPSGSLQSPRSISVGSDDSTAEDSDGNSSGDDSSSDEEDPKPRKITSKSSVLSQSDSCTSLDSQQSLPIFNLREEWHNVIHQMQRRGQSGLSRSELSVSLSDSDDKEDIQLSLSPRSVTTAVPDEDSPEQKEQKRKRQQLKVVQEYLDTENTYLKNLGKLKAKLETPAALQFFNPDHGDFGSRFAIFSDLKKKLDFLIHHVTYYVKEHLEIIAHNQEEGTISNLKEIIPNKLYFMALADFIAATYYLSSNQETINNLAKKNKNFGKFLESFSTDPLTMGQGFSSFLIMPVQRGPRHRLLAEQILKYTLETDPAHADLTVSYNAVIESVKKINSTVTADATQTPQVTGHIMQKIHKRIKSERLKLEPWQLQALYNFPDPAVQDHFIDLYKMAKNYNMNLFEFNISSISYIAYLGAPKLQKKCFKLLELIYQEKKSAIIAAKPVAGAGDPLKKQVLSPSSQTELYTQIDFTDVLAKRCSKDQIEFNQYYNLYKDLKQSRSDINKAYDYMMPFMDNFLRLSSRKKTKCLKLFAKHIDQNPELIDLGPIFAGCK